MIKCGWGGRAVYFRSCDAATSPISGPDLRVEWCGFATIDFVVWDLMDHEMPPMGGMSY